MDGSRVGVGASAPPVSTALSQRAHDRSVGAYAYKYGSEPRSRSGPVTPVTGEVVDPLLPSSAYVGVAVVLAVALSLPVILSPSQALTIDPILRGGSGQVPVSLMAGGLSSVHAGLPYFGVVFQMGGLSTPQLQALGAYYNTTSLTTFRVGGGGEQYDPTTGTIYNPPASGGTYQPVHSVAVNLSWFKAWCGSRSVPCQWLSYLPGEENNTTAAVHVAEWYHKVLGFAPTYWEFDNEPDRWMHYGKNRSTWSTTDASTPTPLAYATMVRNYIAAVTRYFPTDRFVGIEASCDCNTGLITDTAQLSPHLAAMAYHSYPGPPLVNGSLSQFYASLASNQNLSSTSAHFEANVLAQCPSCGNVSLQVGEYQSGPLFNHSPFALAFPGAVWLAASVAQGLVTNLSMFTEFDDTWLYNTSRGSILPEGMLYERVLANLTMGADTQVQLNVSRIGGFYGVLVTNGTRSSLLLVNTNLTTTLALTVPKALFPVGHAGTTWTWTQGLRAPWATRTSALPSSYSIGPQEIVLLDDF